MFLFSSSAAPPAVAAASFASSGSPHDGVATSFRARLLFRFNSTDSDEATPPPYGSGTTKSPDATLRHKARHERAAGNISCAFSHTSVSRSKLLGRVPRPAFHPALRSSTATDAAELAESSEATDELHVICMVFWTPGSSGQIRVLYTFPDSGVKGRMYTSGGGGRGAKGEYPMVMMRWRRRTDGPAECSMRTAVGPPLRTSFSNAFFAFAFPTTAASTISSPIFTAKPQTTTSINAQSARARER